AAVGAFSQKVAPYKITGIKIRPFDEVTGKFEDELAPDSNGGYWNDLSKSVLALVEITGPKGEYVDKRRVSIRVTEGRKLKLTHVGYPGVLGDDGKYYVPVWLYGSMCDTITITATITGQTKPSTMKRNIDFKCGE
ncbi:MAG TPA: hypothetical protein VGI80_06890, partial [Pyrinomonadaceae bacterium]